MYLFMYYLSVPALHIKKIKNFFVPKNKFSQRMQVINNERYIVLKHYFKFEE